MAIDGAWPDIPFPAWKETAAALHLMVQVVGKYRLAHTPWINHSWHATLYVNSSGLTTGIIPDGQGITVEFDLQRQRLMASDGRGNVHQFPLEAMSIAQFDRRFKSLIEQAGGTPRYHGRPSELPDATPFTEDTMVRPWDAEAVTRFHAALVKIEAVFQEFRTGFLGKVSPVHLFWGSFDLAVTCFSGRPAPLHPGGIANLPDDVTREAYSHEVSSAGFWPGGSGVDEPCFYSYAYPSPQGFADQAVSRRLPVLTRRLASSSCLMRQSETQLIRKRPCWPSCSQPIRQPPTPHSGTGQVSNARLAFPGSRGQ